MWPTYFIPKVPDQGYYLTSLPYPLEVIESMESLAAATKGILWNPDPDYMTSSASFVGGTWRELLLHFTAPYESMNSSAAFVGGTWRELLLSFTAPYESMDSSAAFVGGEIDTVLITYSNWPPEPLLSSAFLVGGTLT